MAELLKNLVAGEWVEGKGRGTALLDPVTGAELARVSSQGLDLAAAFSFVRATGLRALAFHHRRPAIQAETAVADALAATPLVL
jgi:3,4-dehydroadipyl-CoA semialdehyde dehydrogenase